MKCSACKLDKEPFLFTPYQLTAPWPRCRKCVSETRGMKFGTSNQHVGMKKMAYTQRRENNRITRVQSDKQTARAEEVKRLVEVRKARLAKEQ